MKKNSWVNKVIIVCTIIIAVCLIYIEIKKSLNFDTTYNISSGSKDLLNKIAKEKILRRNLKRYNNFKVESKKYAKKIKYKTIIK